MTRASVVIVGGGIAGLSAAWELSGGESGPGDSTPRIEVIEASDHFGGVLASTDFADRTIDLGADGFLARRPEAITLIRELGWSNRLEPIEVSGASIFLRGALFDLPTGLAMGIPTSVSQVRSVRGLSWRARLAALRDQYLPARLTISGDTSIGEIVRTKLGRELSYRFIEPMVGGIQAGRIDDLSAKSVFPPLYDAAMRGGSLMKAMQPPTTASPTTPVVNEPMFYSLDGGLGSLPQELVRRLVERGVVLRLGAQVTGLRRTASGRYSWEVDTSTTTTPADAVILAVPAPISGQLLGSLDARLERLSAVDSAGAAMVTFSVPSEHVSLPDRGTGVLIPLGTAWSGDGSMMVTAITLLDRKWPRLRREDNRLVRAHVGRIDDSRWTTMSDEELTLRVTQELGSILPLFNSPSGSVVQRWPHSLPQYRVGHPTLISDAKEAAALLSIALCGNAYDGVGVPASIGSGRRAALETNAILAKLADELGAR